MRLASTRLGGIFFTTLWPWVDRLCLRLSRGRFSIAGIGIPTLLLTTRGRKTGKPRSVPLLYQPDGNTWVVAGSRGGRPDHPAWYLNLKSSPEVEVLVDGASTPCLAAEASGTERERLWQILEAVYPGFGVYEQRLNRQIPVIVLTPRSDHSRCA